MQMTYKSVIVYDGIAFFYIQNRGFAKSITKAIPMKATSIGFI